MTKNTAKTLTLTATKAPRKAAPLAVPKTATSYILEGDAAAKVTVVKTRSRLAVAVAEDQADVASVDAAPEVVQDAGPAPTVVRKRVSKLAALKLAEAAEEAPLAAAPKVAKLRIRKTDVEPTVIITGGQSVSQTTDAATLAAIDTSGYLLPSVKVPGRRGRKPS
ncbi:MAG TPA: RNA polymerase sigma factor RpoD, partial [Telluria sp.]|nr:RNA polymerase sigma factor RpoD [Telluria sp.]